jgi:hypothetical protein
MIRSTRHPARTPFAVALVLFALLAAPLATPAGAQARAASAESRLATRLDDATRQAVVAIVESAQRQRLPVEPLVDKALEGASKGAPSARIVGAVRALATSLERSRSILGPEASDADVLAGANALRQGVSPEMLKRLREQRLRGGMTVALGVLTELSARGAPADTVARALVALSGAGASEVQLAEFGRDVEHDIASGIASPMTAVATRTESFLTAGDRNARIPAPKQKP